MFTKNTLFLLSFFFIETEKYLNRVIRIHFLYCTWKHAKGREVKIARSKVANITRNVSERIHVKNLKNEARLLKNAIFLGDMSSFAGCKRRRGNDKIIG